MATLSSVRPSGVRSSDRYTIGGLVVRFCLVGAALASIAWGIFCFPVFVDQMRLEATQNLIIQNLPIGRDAIDGLMPLLDQAAARNDCVPVIDRSSAVVRLRLAENAFTAELQDKVEDRMTALDRALRKSLGCSPTDPYLWLVLFWTRNTREGFSPANFDLLRLSYRLGPNEGWFIQKRSQLALALFESLPTDLVDQVVAEFARLVKSELYTEAMNILSGPGWRYRDRLMAGLSGVPPRNIAIFVKAMVDIGFDVGGLVPSGRRN